jgi:hypothetical protein
MSEPLRWDESLGAAAGVLASLGLPNQEGEPT